MGQVELDLLRRVPPSAVAEFLAAGSRSLFSRFICSFSRANRASESAICDSNRCNSTSSLAIACMFFWTSGARSLIICRARSNWNSIGTLLLTESFRLAGRSADVAPHVVAAYEQSTAPAPEDAANNNSLDHQLVLPINESPEKSPDAAEHHSLRRA